MRGEWSDRVIATTTGLSAKTVGAIRCATADNQQLHKNRLGKDGRVRPLNTAARRQLAAELIASQPQAPLRQIAQIAGISASTVRDVRARVRRGDDPVPSPQLPPRATYAPRHRKPSHPALANTAEPAHINRVLHALSRDPALRMNAAGRELLRWLHLHAVDCTDSQKVPESIPAHCVDHLIELARHCSANWARIADDLARRGHDRRGPGAEVAGR
jgi:hypothetical protein